jgi:hypothetical protein
MVVKAQHQRVNTIIVLMGLPIVTVIALWFPFGFSLGGLVEEWDILFLFARDGVFYIANGGSPLQIHQARPLTILPQALAYTLDPDSFFYWHLIQAASLVVKGTCAGIIGIYLTNNRALAASLGLLTILYPADTMQLSFRALHINWAVALALVGTVLILSAYHIERRPARIVMASTASIFFGAALLMYEVVVGLAVLGFLVIFARRGQAIIPESRKKLDVYCIWLISIAVWLSFYIWTIRSGAQYHLSALSDANISSIMNRSGALASSGLYRAFYECWVELFSTFSNLSSFVYPLLFTLIILVALLWLGAASSTSTDIVNSKLAPRIAGVGLIAFIFAYAPYLSTYPLLLITQRTFLAAAIGAALVIFSGILLLLTVLDRRVVAALSASIIGGCFVAELNQFDKYNRTYAAIIKPVLLDVVPFISRSANHSYSVLFNEYGYLSGTWDLGIELQLALGYVLPKAQVTRIFICEARSGRLLPRLPGPTLQRGSCERVEDGVVVGLPGMPPALLNDAAIATLRIDGTALVERPNINFNAETLPNRATQLFALSTWHPVHSMFRRAESPDRYECRFESMWGYAVPCRAFGFFDGASYRTALDASYAWIGESSAGLIFDINPTEGDYTLVVEVLDIVSSSRQLGVRLNGISLLTRSSADATRIEATFSSTLLKNENNTIEFTTQLDDKLGLSFAIKRIAVSPKGKRNSEGHRWGLTPHGNFEKMVPTGVIFASMPDLLSIFRGLE